MTCKCDQILDLFEWYFFEHSNQPNDWRKAGEWIKEIRQGCKGVGFEVEQ